MIVIQKTLSLCMLMKTHPFAYSTQHLSLCILNKTHLSANAYHLIYSYTSSSSDLSVETKEVKLTPKTDIHDAADKLKSVQKFLEKVSRFWNRIFAIQDQIYTQIQDLPA
jgi:hypothetical protein